MKKIHWTEKAAILWVAALTLVFVAVTVMAQVVTPTPGTRAKPDSNVLPWRGQTYCKQIVSCNSNTSIWTATDTRDAARVCVQNLNVVAGDSVVICFGATACAVNGGWNLTDRAAAGVTPTSQQCFDNVKGQAVTCTKVVNNVSVNTCLELSY